MCRLKGKRGHGIMPRVLTDGKISIGAFKFPDRKKPCLCIQEGAKIVIYGTFNNDYSANKFMNKLGEFIGAEFEEESEETE